MSSAADVPTFEMTERFRKDFTDLDPSDKERLKKAARDQFVPDLGAGHFRAGLRVKGVRGADGVFEMSWAPDGRATWQYGQQLTPGEPHIVWRRIGTHGVFTAP